MLVGQFILFSQSYTRQHSIWSGLVWDEHMPGAQGSRHLPNTDSCLCRRQPNMGNYCSVLVVLACNIISFIDPSEKIVVDPLAFSKVCWPGFGVRM